MKKPALAVALIIRAVILAGAVYALWINKQPYSTTVIGGLITALVGYLGTYGGEYFSRKEPDPPPNAPRPPNQFDIDLFRRLRILLKPEKTIQFMYTNDFSGSFYRSLVQDIYEFADQWQYGDHQFIDPELEGVRAKLWKTADVFSEKTAQYCIPSQYVEGKMTVQLQHLGGEDEQPPGVWKQAEEINDAARNFAKWLEQMVKLGKEKLPSWND